MTPGTEFRRRSVLPAVAAIAAACALAALPASALAGDAGEGALSPRLTALATPAIGSASTARQARKLSLAPSGPGSLLRTGNRVLVDVRFDSGAASSSAALREAGAEIVDVSSRYQTVTVAATPASLPEIAAVAGVQSVTEDLAPIVYGAGESPLTSAAPGECEGGAAISEGVEQLLAKKGRADFGVSGSGVTVGVLSDSFDKDKSAFKHAANDVESGDLPGAANPCATQKTPVKVIEDLSGSKSEVEAATDEGRAMLQIVDDVAPGASLAFATAFKGETSFAQNIEKLAKPVIEGGAGAKVVVDDVAYFAEPFFQDGPVAAAIKKVTEGGASYFSAAGNDNLLDAAGREIASWEAPQFRDSSSCPPAMAAISELKASHCMDFDPGSGVDNTFGITVAAGATLTVDLQWAEPWDGVGTDLDALLLDAGGEPVLVGGSLVGSADDNPGGGRPFEFFQWENPGATTDVQLAINRYSGGNPRLKFALMENGGGVTETEYPSSSGGDVVGPTVFGHSGSTAAISVAAIRFNTTASPENYSSRGPVTHYFEPVSGSPATALPAPEVISKPDVTATDCGVTTFFVLPSFRFCGTSAAAPHAGAVAALMLEAEPAATPGELRSALLSGASPVGAFGPCAVGAGLVNAPGAIAQILAPPAGPVALSCQPPVSVPVPPVATASASPEIAAKPAVQTSFAQRPHRVVKTHTKSAFVSFRFRSDQGGTFLCSIDRGAFRSCHRKLARWFSLGPHTVQVVAMNSAGEADPTPAVFHFRVTQIG